MSAHPAQRHSEPVGVQRSSRPHRLSATRLLEGRGFNGLRLGVDVVMLSLAVAAARAGADRAGVSTQHDWVLFLFPPLAILLLYLRGMYQTRLRYLILDGIAPVVGAISIAAMTVIAVTVFVDKSSHPAPLTARAWLFAVVYVGAGRILLALSQRRARRRGLLCTPTLIVGAGVVGARVARRLEEVPDYGLTPVGFLDDDPPPSVQVVDRRAPVLGSPDELAEIAASTGARHVVLAFTQSPDSDLPPLVRRCHELDLDVSLVPRVFESINERIELEHLGGMPLLGLHSTDPKGAQFAIKHALDRVAAVLAMVVLAPLVSAVALAVKRSSPGPIFYRQRRVGRDGQAFDLYKFRSMRVADERADFHPEPGSAPGGVEGADRRTGVGRFIRRTAIDELPQLINVMRGEMSLIGPRPERPEFVSLFHHDVDRYGDRHRVKSGLTGWAQVHGYRGQTSLSDRVEWDNFYIENWSLYLDFKILLLTVMAVVRHTEELE